MIENNPALLTKTAVPVRSKILLDADGSLRPFFPEDDDEIGAESSTSLLAAFEQGSAQGLLRLCGSHLHMKLPPNLSWWRQFALLVSSRLCRAPGWAPDESDLKALIDSAPHDTGVFAHRGRDHLHLLCSSMAEALDAAAGLAKCNRRELLSSLNPDWDSVGRVHFNLGEDLSTPATPFSFSASYALGIDEKGQVLHRPLGQVIRTFALQKRQSELDTAVGPLVAASDKAAWARAAAGSPGEGPLFKASKWSPSQAMEFLRDAPIIEKAGIRVRLPVTWGGKMPPRASARASIGNFEPAMIGSKALLDFDMEVALGTEKLTSDEIKELTEGADGLRILRGQWIQVDQAALKGALNRFEALAEKAAKEGLTFSEAMKLAASSRNEPAVLEDPTAAPTWTVAPGEWLEKTLTELRKPENIAKVDPGELLYGTTLRPYQAEGLRWLHLLHTLGLGALLADDMGLGKTIQILSLLLVLNRDLGPSPSLLIAPASLLDNWANEASKFAPSLKVGILRAPTKKNKNDKADFSQEEINNLDLAIVSYGGLLNSDILRKHPWRLAIADEAQSIKNPETKSAKACKDLNAESRFALTGTPVENRLGDLWSILDFTHPGLLGSRTEFNTFHAKLREKKNLEPLRELVAPYILRRKKTDKTVISDLPEKIETIELCHLTAKQAALYQTAVDDMRKELMTAKGFGRNGVVISCLTRLKQICNHPSHFLRDGAWKAADSGKLLLLRELAQEIADAGERLLVFTQYQEAVAPLTDHLSKIFGSNGLSIHGGVRAGSARQSLVKEFQSEEGPPFMVLTVKAGGTGLTLTAANHVIHFDRWWNPAVENQATDRAYRIGQTKNVMVHKLVTKGTVEERIDEMIASKIQLAEDAIGDASGASLSSLSDQELLDLVKLDLSSVADD